MDFGDRLSEVRRERGLTQTLLAERAGISASMVHRYESGAAQPTLDVVRRLAVALSISADTLIFADSPRT
ncbi:MAG TPA: helix-turn-helix transcriptional regulator, partial [Acidimicrobiales bacterium]|nr:helix-turn-helix transcriptional regulator [Acidimicrobiales bacterium]